jgi:hypothetical protein
MQSRALAPGFFFMWLVNVVAHLLLLVALTWRGLVWQRLWFSVAVCQVAAQYVVLSQIPPATSLYFWCFLGFDVIELGATALATRDAHHERIAQLGPSGRMGSYAWIAAAAVAAVSVAILFAAGEWADSWQNWPIRWLQLGRHAVRAVLFVFTLFSCALLDHVDETAGAGRLHQRMLLGWLASGLVCNVIQLSVFGGRANYDLAGLIDSTWILAWAASVALGAFDHGRGDQSIDRRA